MKVHPEISQRHADWIARQRMFFVGTAPLSSDGHVNLSPKGGNAFRILGPLEVAYLDYTGSGAETIAHLRENGRIVIMFCAFDGAPQILRLHGKGSAYLKGGPEFSSLSSRFPESVGARSIIHVNVTRVADSCGYSVPLYEYQADRDVLDRWSEKKGLAGIAAYQAEKNKTSIDGLPAIR